MILVVGAAATSDLVVRVDALPAPHAVGRIGSMPPASNGWLPGGSAAAVALAVAQHAPVRLWAPLPHPDVRADAERRLLRLLDAAGIDTTWCPSLPTPVRCLIVVDDTGRRLCWSEEPRVAAPDPAVLDGVRHVVFTPRWGAWSDRVLGIAVDSGVPVSFIGEIPPRPDVPWSIAVADRQQFAETPRLRAELRVETDGTRGATVHRARRHDHVPAVPTTVVDTTGAGDVFGGTLVGAVHAGMTALSAARLASVRAAAHCGVWGALPDAASATGEASITDPHDVHTNALTHREPHPGGSA